MQRALLHLRPSDRYGAWAVIRNVVPLFALLALAPIFATRSLAVAWVVAPIVGLFLYRVTIVMHDCIHRTLFRSRRVNDRVGRMLGAVTGIDVQRFRAQHWKHHRSFGRAEDPQGFHYFGVWRLSRAQFAWHLLKPLFGANLRYVLAESMLHPGNLRRTAWRGDPLLFAAMQLALALVVTGGGRYLSLVLLPFVSAATFGLFFSQLRGLAEHGPSRSAPPAGFVRSHAARTLERMFLYDLHFNYHSAHHRWPQVPSCHLPWIHERYLAPDIPLEPSMLRTVTAIRAS